MALTPARSGRSAGQGSAFLAGRGAASRSPVSSGWGCSQPVVGGRIWASRARAALMSPATPAAALVWPMFALIEPMAAGGTIGSPRLAEGAAERPELGRIADGRPGAVPLEVGDRLDPEARPAIGAAEGQELPLDLRAGDPALAVGGDPPAADDRDDATALGQGVVQPHEHDDPAAFARPEAGGPRRRRPASRRWPGRRPWRSRPARTGRGSGRPRPPARRRGRPPPATSRRGPPPAATTRTPRRPCSRPP